MQCARPHVEKIWVIIPAFNEAGAIRETIQNVRAHFNNVIVVDDCSIDQTAELALAAGAFVARHPVNLGQGAALATGIRFALFRGASHVVTFDSDGQHSSDDAWNLLQTQIETGCDVVLGSRFLGSTTGMPPMRGLLLKCALAFTKFTTGLALTDVHNGLRVFTREAATKLAIRQNRMAHASEILSEIARKQLSYVEAPCTIRYTEYSKRKGQKWTAMFIILKDLFVARLHR